MTDVLDFYSADAIIKRLERLANEPDPKPPTPRAVQERDGPCDCVREFPVIGEQAVELVGFDLEGVPRIAIRFGLDVPVEGWERWILRWVRLRYGQRLLSIVD